MKKYTVLLVVLVLMGVHSVSATNLAWTITTSGTQDQIGSGVKYYLKVTSNDYHLAYKSRSFGINLAWEKAAAPNIQIEKAGGGKINCGDKVALRVNEGGYLKYQKRTWGINLVWSTTPVYEWELRNEENKSGTSVKTNAKIAIYNSVENDFMEYCVRATPTVNLGWAKDCADGWRAPGITNKARDWVPYIEKAITYGGPLIALL